MKVIGCSAEDITVFTRNTLFYVILSGVSVTNKVEESLEIIVCSETKRRA